MKVVKFGGSSMADAGQYRKIRDILLADPDRRVVIVSAAGKRNKQDHKITDLLYLCYAHTQYGVDCSGVFEMITSRYREIARLSTPKMMFSSSGPWLIMRMLMPAWPRVAKI